MSLSFCGDIQIVVLNDMKKGFILLCINSYQQLKRLIPNFFLQLEYMHFTP